MKFPKYISVFNRSVYKYNSGRYYPLDFLNPTDNIIPINNEEFVFTYLDVTEPSNKGGNSIILKLYEPGLIDNSTSGNPIYPDVPNRILKIERNPIKTKKFGQATLTRFEKEIIALDKCLKCDFQNVIRMYEFGICEIFNRNKDDYEKHRFYTMEYAPFDLKSFIEINHMTVDFEFKLNLCLSLAKGLEELRRLDYYHRDIKPDNIFFIDGDWKIGDLGLISERNKQFEIDRLAEAIGPKGWMSPESMNKYLTEGKGFTHLYDCLIDHRSDIFQLGKVFWYIFNFNAPIGCIKPIDMHSKDNDIYPIMRRMLNHNKKKRYSTIEDVIVELKRISLKSLKTITY